MRTLHQRRKHPTPVPGCYGCHVSTVAVGLSPEVKAVESSERVLRKDLDAYKALRMQGLQPEHLRGSADLAANATHRVEVEHPKLWRSLDADGRAHIDEALHAVREAPPGLKVAGEAP